MDAVERSWLFLVAGGGKVVGKVMVVGGDVISLSYTRGYVIYWGAPHNKKAGGRLTLDPVWGRSLPMTSTNHHRGF